MDQGNGHKRRFGGIRKLPSGRFQAYWRDRDGHTHNGPGTFVTRDAGEAWLAEQRLVKMAQDRSRPDPLPSDLASVIRQAVADGISEAVHELIAEGVIR